MKRKIISIGIVSIFLLISFSALSVVGTQIKKEETVFKTSGESPTISVDWCYIKKIDSGKAISYCIIIDDTLGDKVKGKIDFGDGNCTTWLPLVGWHKITEPTILNPTGTLVIMGTHPYSKGTYTLTFMAKDKAGNTASVTCTKTIDNEKSVNKVVNPSIKLLFDDQNNIPILQKINLKNLLVIKLINLIHAKT